MIRPEVFVLLALGHILADFLFQTRKMVEEKQRSRKALFRHALTVTTVQGAVVLPFSLSAGSIALVAAIGVTHFFIDSAKIAIDKRWPYPLRWFAFDQLLHFAVLAFMSAEWPRQGSGVALPTWGIAVALTACVYVFNWTGGSAVVSLLFQELRRGKEAPEHKDTIPGAGRVIGYLERTLIVTLVWCGQWSAVGFVLAAKSIARFKELEKQEFAEIYLIGTMTSVLVAIASGVLLAWLTVPRSLLHL